MDVILNIGLAREGNSNIGQGTVLREVVATFGMAAITFRHSDTELTCVASVRADHLDDGVRAKVRFLARLLGHDYIAIYCPSIDKGELIGPRDKKWNTFNREFFIMPNGCRLSQLAAQAA